MADPSEMGPSELGPSGMGPSETDPSEAAIEILEVPARGMSFTTRVAGPPDGRPVILLHGFPETSAEWHSQMDALAGAGYRAVAPDQRGYSPGARPEGVGPYAATELVDDVIGIADAMGFGLFDLVGHDWGGAVAWLAAATQPKRLTTLTVVSTPHPAAFAVALGSEESDQAQRSSYMEFFRKPEAPEAALLSDGASRLREMFPATGLVSDKAAIEEYVSVLTQPGAMTAALNWYRAMSAGGFGAVGPITTPVLYVWSTGDVALGRDAAEATASYVEGLYRFRVLEGVSHWIPEHAPGELNRLLLEHLGSFARPAGAGRRCRPPADAGDPGPRSPDR